MPPALRSALTVPLLMQFVTLASTSSSVSSSETSSTMSSASRLTFSLAPDSVWPILLICFEIAFTSLISAWLLLLALLFRLLTMSPMLVRLLLRSLRLAVMASRFVSSTFGISTSTESGNASEMSLSTSLRRAGRQDPR